MPAFDEKYIIGSEVAAEALYRRIPQHELAEKRKSWRFWASASVPLRDFLRSPPTLKPRGVLIPKKKSLLSDLKGSGMVKWGARRQVRFLTRHVEKPTLTVSANSIKDDEEDDSMEVPISDESEEDKQSEGDEEQDEEQEEEEEEEQVEEDVKTYMLRQTPRNGKRKRPEPNSCRAIVKRKMPRREKKCQIVAIKHKKHKVLKNSIDRWSADRYKLAEVNMLKIMKEKGAVSGNPVLRPELRTAARRLIGDTGLLDHLLKHMAGKVAPGGEERFRRRHNAEGAMEYWLEKADLVDIRRQAGVQDPYWIPPPGWKLGDNPSQDPVCSRELKNLRGQMAQVKK